MADLLQDKSLAIKFQIMVEIAKRQLDIQQKDIAKSLNVTPQWISKYIIKLAKDGWIVAEGRSKYRVTVDGVDWLLKVLRQMQNYFDGVEKIVRNLTISAAVAEYDVQAGQIVGLVMKEGLLTAGDFNGNGAKGVAVTSAKAGEDLGVSNIEGIIELEKGKITVLKIPNIQKGGSKIVDLSRLRKEISDEKIIGAIGTEALVTLKRIGLEPQSYYGTKETIIKAAQCGLSCVVICVEDNIPDLLQSLGDEHLEYRLLELAKTK
jgi:putative transcriptional regulator